MQTHTLPSIYGKAKKGYALYDTFHRGARKLKGENLKVVLAEFSTFR
jgi:hypothetical protein